MTPLSDFSADIRDQPAGRRRRDQILKSDPSTRFLSTAMIMLPSSVLVLAAMRSAPLVGLLLGVILGLCLGIIGTSRSIAFDSNGVVVRWAFKKRAFSWSQVQGFSSSRFKQTVVGCDYGRLRVHVTTPDGQSREVTAIMGLSDIDADVAEMMRYVPPEHQSRILDHSIVWPGTREMRNALADELAQRDNS